MAITHFIAAIELGSSKIRGIVGTKNIDGSIKVLAYADEDSSDFIHKGIVYNLDKTSQSLSSIIKRLEEKLKEKITKVYVGMSGQSLRSVHNSISRSILGEKDIVTQELVDSLCDENLEVPLIDLDILSVEPQEYKIGNNLQIDPIGVATEHIEGRFLNIVANSELKHRIEYSFKQANIKIADLLISPLTTANLILSEKEKRAGCALIDFGAQTTTVSIYRDNLLRFLTIIPLGGDNVTKDLMSLQIEGDEAEAIKLSIGNAWIERNGHENDEEEKAQHTLEDGRKIDLEEIQFAIEARSEEIVANAWNQIQIAGYDDKLLAGIIITGGAGNIHNLRKLMQEKTTIAQIRLADNMQNKIHSTHEDFNFDISKNTILGLLHAGKDNCREIPINNEPADLFESDQELKKQEEQAKIALQEKKQAEEKEKEKIIEKKEKKKKNPWGILGDIGGILFSDDDLNESK